MTQAAQVFRTEPRHGLAIDLDTLEANGGLDVYARNLLRENARRAGSLPWVETYLDEQLWGKEREILESVEVNRRTIVKSCHEVGKSFTAARVVARWLDKHEPGEAFVVTTAPTAYQVKSVLWREIARCHQKGNLRGRLNLTEWWMNITRNGKEIEELVGFGRKPDEFDVAAFQGIHAPYVLVVVDEGWGVHGPIWEALDSLIANDNSKMLIIGNPDDPMAEASKYCRPGSGYHVVNICAFDSPNFTGEPMAKATLDQLIGRTYVEEKRKSWAGDWIWVDTQGEPCDYTNGVRVVPPHRGEPTLHDLMQVNPFWCSKVLGEVPPVSGERVLIPLAWIKSAQERDLSARAAKGPNVLGVDMGAGGDSSDIAHRRGPVVRIILEQTNPDTMQTVGDISEALTTTGATEARIDEIGIGKGAKDRLKELGKPVIGVNVGVKAEDDEHYENLKAEAYWQLRERFEQGDIDIDANDEDTAAELADIRYERSSRGRLKIESKEAAKKRGVRSPNRAEAVMLAYLVPREEDGGSLAGKATW